MIHYIPTNTQSEEFGWSLSEAMWALSVPSHNNTTRYYCGVRVHPETSEVYLAIDDNDDQPVHLNASVQPLIDMLTAVDSEERTNRVMGVHHGNRPTGNDRMVPKLLNHYYGSGAAAAYSLRNLDYLKRNDPVVRARRASDNEERDFTAAEVLSDLETWTNTVPDLPLEISPNAVPAYSLRNLSDSFSGAVIRVRESGNNSEQDFTAEEITNGTLENFCGSNDGFVTVWYDQSGNNFDAVENTASNQPQIVNNGNIIYESGKPAILFNLNYDTGLRIQLPSVDFYSNKDFSSFIKCRKSTNSSFSHNLIGQDFSRGFDLLDNNGKPRFDHISVAGTTSFNFQNTDLATTQNLIISYILDFQNQDDYAFLNSKTPDSQPSYTHSEVIFYDSNQLSNRTKIESNMASYYDIDIGQVDAFVTTWYDQSGNDNHATQTTATEQPKIVSSGQLETFQNKPSIIGEGNGYFSLNNTINFNQNYAFFFVLEKTASGDANAFIGAAPEFIWEVQVGTYNIRFQDNSNFTYASGGSVGDPVLLYCERVGSQVKMAKNGLTGVTDTNSANFRAQNLLTGFYENASYNYRKHISEIILYPSDQSANRTAIESNINSYYDIY